MAMKGNMASRLGNMAGDNKGMSPKMSPPAGPSGPGNKLKSTGTLKDGATPVKKPFGNNPSGRNGNKRQAPTVSR